MAKATKQEKSTKRAAMQVQSLQKAVSGQALTNYPAIIEGFMEKGIAAADIKPRENVFTFNAWKALGRVVKKGEHGVKVVTIVERVKVGEDGNKEVKKFPSSTTVFHISQTQELGAKEETAPASH